MYNYNNVELNSESTRYAVRYTNLEMRLQRTEYFHSEKETTDFINSLDPYKYAITGVFGETEYSVVYKDLDKDMEEDLDR